MKDQANQPFPRNFRKTVSPRSMAFEKAMPSPAQNKQGEPYVNVSGKLNILKEVCKGSLYFFAQLISPKQKNRLSVCEGL